MNIDYIHEPTDLQCGQAVLAMLLGTTAEYICEYLGNSRETDLREMKRVLTDHGINFSPERKQAQTVFDLPRCALLSLETPRCWHWSLYADGVFYDPEHGILGDFPPSARRFYWKIFPETLFPMGLATAGGSFMSVVFCTGLFLLLQRQKRQEKGI